MQKKTTRSLAITGGIALSTLAVGMVASRPRPLFRVEAQKLIDEQLCQGLPCPIDADASLSTEASDHGIGFRTTISAPRQHVVPATPYGVPSGRSRFGVIGIASRTTLSFWWNSAVNIGIRPYQHPPNIVLVDDRYAARRLEWVKRNWESAPKADLYAELTIARTTHDYTSQAEALIAKLIMKPESAAPKSIDSFY